MFLNGKPSRGVSRASFAAAALFLTLFFTLLFAARKVGVTWDETTFFSYSEGLLRWWKMGPSFDTGTLTQVWNASPYLNPHPPFFKVLSSLFAAASDSVLPFPLSFRLGHIFFSSACLTLVFLILVSDFGIFAAVTAALMVALQPRLFAEFFIGTLDGPVALGWLLLSLLAWKIARSQAGRARAPWWILFFSLHAILAASKINGFLAVIPVILYFSIRRDARAVLLSFTSCFTALCFVALLAPDQWATPWTPVFSYLSYPFNRHSVVRVATYYLGQVHRENSLPWHYFLVMTLATTPPLHLGLLLLAPFSFFGKKLKGLALALLPALLLLTLFGLVPSVPKHDGVRQLTAFLTILSMYGWMGLQGCWEKYYSKRSAPGAALKKAAFSAIPLAGALLALLRTHPYELSYYNEFVGRLAGAEEKGFEITYYFDAINPAALHWLNENLPKEASLGILPIWPDLLALYQRHGLLRSDLRIAPALQETRADFLVLMRRRSLVNDVDYLGLPAVFAVEHEGVSLVKVVRHP